MNRVYLFATNITLTKQIVADVRAYGLEDSALSVIAGDRNLALEPLPEAGLTETSDLLNAAKKGAAAGGAMGLLGGLLAVTFPPSGLAIGGAGVLSATAVGSALGTWMSSMIGISVPNEDLQEFQDRIDAGEVLILIDVEPEREESLISYLQKHHPDIEIHRGELEAA